MVALIVLLALSGLSNVLLGWLWFREQRDHTATVDAYLMEKSYLDALKRMLELAAENFDRAKEVE